MIEHVVEHVCLHTHTHYLVLIYITKEKKKSREERHKGKKKAKLVTVVNKLSKIQQEGKYNEGSLGLRNKVTELSKRIWHVCLGNHIL